MTNDTVSTNSAKTNTLALVGFILALVGLLFGTLFTIAGLVLGHLGLKQIKETGEQGQGMALSAVIIGWVTIGLTIVGIVVVILISIFVGWAWLQHGVGSSYYDNA